MLSMLAVCILLSHTVDSVHLPPDLNPLFLSDEAYIAHFGERDNQYHPEQSNEQSDLEREIEELQRRYAANDYKTHPCRTASFILCFTITMKPRSQLIKDLKPKLKLQQKTAAYFQKFGIQTGGIGITFSVEVPEAYPRVAATVSIIKAVGYTTTEMERLQLAIRRISKSSARNSDRHLLLILRRTFKFLEEKNDPLRSNRISLTQMAIGSFALYLFYKMVQLCTILTR